VKRKEAGRSKILHKEVITMGKMQYNDFIELVRQRRSVRKVKPDPIPDEFVEEILEAGRWGMSGGNGQPWEFIVVKHQKTKDEMARTWNELRDEVNVIEMTRVEELRHPLASHPYAVPPWKDAPVLIVVCGDKRAYQATVLGGIFLGGEGGMMESCYLKNMATAVQIIHLAAASLGLGSQWLSVIRPWEQLLKPILNVPVVLDIHSVVVLGYPAYDTPTPYRRELKEIVHYEKYDKSKYRTGKDVIKWLHTSRVSIRSADGAAYNK
jgi:nitroreductase